MFALPDFSRWCFVDVETTGSSPARERVTEVGVVCVDVEPADADATRPNYRVSEWSSLVNPGVPIPAEIQWLTGITNDMVRAAPRFDEIAADLAERLHGAVFVAHNARFDYGFLRAEFMRAGINWRTATLCTVRLSRHLFPDRGPHSLDAIVARFGLDGETRHRALGDARVIWRLLQRLDERDADELAVAVRLLLSRPATPPHLPPNALDDLPHTPGIYRFYGLNRTVDRRAAPIYIGKAVDLRARVANHFDNDVRSGADLRLSQEVTQIDWEETAGEFGAWLREAEAIKAELPAHNLQLRRRATACLVRFDAVGRPAYLTAAAVPTTALADCYGPFSSRAAARRLLIERARAQSLCLKVMRLETRGRRSAGDGAAGAAMASSDSAACFNWQLRRCLGACHGQESGDAHAARVHAALADLRMPIWPHDSAIGIQETDPRRGRTDIHVVDQWCWLGSVRSERAAFELAGNAPRVFEPDAYRIIRRALVDRRALRATGARSGDENDSGGVVSQRIDRHGAPSAAGRRRGETVTTNPAEVSLIALHVANAAAPTSAGA